MKSCSKPVPVKWEKRYPSTYKIIEDISLCFVCFSQNEGSQELLMKAAEKSSSAADEKNILELLKASLFLETSQEPLEVWVWKMLEAKSNTLQGINISHLGKRKIIFKMPFWGDMLVPWRVTHQPLHLNVLSRFFQPWNLSRSVNCRCNSNFSSPLVGINGLWRENHLWVFKHTVDGQNPAPPRMMIIPLFIGF